MEVLNQSVAYRSITIDQLVFSCRQCICSAAKLHMGIVDLMDCSDTELNYLPASPSTFFVEVCDMSGTPYCEAVGNDDHQSVDSRFGLIVCESGEFLTGFKVLK